MSGGGEGWEVALVEAHYPASFTAIAKDESINITTKKIRIDKINDQEYESAMPEDGITINIKSHDYKNITEVVSTINNSSPILKTFGISFKYDEITGIVKLECPNIPVSVDNWISVYGPLKPFQPPAPQAQAQTMTEPIIQMTDSDRLVLNRLFEIQRLLKPVRSPVVQQAHKPEAAKLDHKPEPAKLVHPPPLPRPEEMTQALPFQRDNIVEVPDLLPPSVKPKPKPPKPSTPPPPPPPETHTSFRIELSIKLSKSISLQLGFDPQKDRILRHKSQGSRPADIRYGIPSDMYVYCDLVEPQLVGDTVAPLLKIVNIHNSDSSTTSRHDSWGIQKTVHFHDPHYVPVMKSAFETVEIDLRDNTGANVPFRYGDTCMKLHLRRSQQQQQ